MCVRHQLLETVPNKKSRESTTDSALVEEIKKLALGKKSLRSPLRNTTIDAGLRSPGQSYRQEKQTAEEAGFMKHIPCPS